MSRKRLLFSFAGLFILAILISFSIHLLHKDAYALNTYKITCLDEGDAGIPNVAVVIEIDGEDPVPGETDAFGNFMISLGGEPEGWTATMLDDDDWNITDGSPTGSNPAVWSNPGNQVWWLEEVE